MASASVKDFNCPNLLYQWPPKPDLSVQRSFLYCGKPYCFQMKKGQKYLQIFLRCAQVELRVAVNQRGRFPPLYLCAACSIGLTLWVTKGVLSFFIYPNLYCLPRWCCLRPPPFFLWFLWPPKASSGRQDEGLLRDLDDADGGEGLEDQGGYHVHPLSPTTDLWGLCPSLNICLSPCTVGDWCPLMCVCAWGWGVDVESGGTEAHGVGIGLEEFRDR